MPGPLSLSRTDALNLIALMRMLDQLQQEADAAAIASNDSRLRSRAAELRLGMRSLAPLLMRCAAALESGAA